MSKITLLIEHELDFINPSLMAVLEREPRFVVVGSTILGDDTANLYQMLQPDVSIVSLRTISQLELAMLRHVTSLKHAPAMLLISESQSNRCVASAFAAGVRGYQHGPSLSDTALVSAVMAVASGGIFMDAAAFASLHVDRPLTARISAAPEQRPVSLTQEEGALLRLVALGHGNTQIGHMLRITAKTVSNRLSQLYATLHVDNCVQAANLALRCGMIDLDETL